MYVVIVIWLQRSGGIPQVKCRHLADRSYTSGAIRRIDHALVTPPGGKVTTKTTQIRASYYLKWRLLADRSYISIAPLRIVHKLILSKFVCLFLMKSKWRYKLCSVPSQIGHEL